MKLQKEQDLQNYLKEQERRNAEEQARLEKEKAYEAQKKMIETLEQDKMRLLKKNEELMQIYSSQKSIKSNTEEQVITLYEDTDYSPSKQFLRKNLEESSFLPDQVIPVKQEKKRNIIKKVRFHDD